MSTKGNRSMISRMEPVIILKDKRYRGRNYKVGSHLDRRRVQMSHSKLVRLIKAGVCILAQDLDTKTLASYGWKYDSLAPRLKLVPIEKVIKKKAPKKKVKKEVVKEKALPWALTTDTVGEITNE
jgi:hypothetical protein